MHFGRNKSDYGRKDDYCVECIQNDQFGDGLM